MAKRRIEAEVPTGESGHVQALKVLDELLALPKNLRTLRKALQTKFDEDACSFFDFYIMKQVPKLKTTSVEQPSPAPIEIHLTGDPAPKRPARKTRKDG